MRASLCLLRLLCLPGLLAVVGCGGPSRAPSMTAASESAADYAAAPESPSVHGEAATNAAQRYAATDAPAGAAGGAAAPTEGMRPKIIYTAEVSLIVEDFAATERALLELVASHGGYVADSYAQRSKGAARSGRWVVRVPTGRYDTFLAGLDRLGYIADRRQTASDVTAEFIDVQARIANLKRLEERLVGLLENRDGQLEDLLRIEQELARVRGEVEQAEGRLRYLTNKTDFSTVTVVVREQQDYVPPQPAPDPSFGSRIAATWADSLTALRKTAESAALLAVAAAPWLAVAALPFVVLGLLVWLVRRRRRR